MPNFLIIGVSKAGTTSLDYYLQQHPEIYMAEGKETYFFNFENDDSRFNGPGDDERVNFRVVRTLDDYQHRFNGVTNEKAIGECCGPYMYDPKATLRIQSHLPDAKLIAVLRHPVERAYSAYMHVIREGHEQIQDFRQALQKEDERIKLNWRYMWRYTQTGYYYEQVKRYMDLFDPGQIKIYLFEEDFIDRPLWMLQSIFRFLEVDESFVPDMTRKLNSTGHAHSQVLRAILTKKNPVKEALKAVLPMKYIWRVKNKVVRKNLIKPPMDGDLRRELIAGFREDIEKLQALIGRDLSRWLV